MEANFATTGKGFKIPKVKVWWSSQIFFVSSISGGNSGANQEEMVAPQSNHAHSTRTCPALCPPIHLIKRLNGSTGLNVNIIGKSKSNLLQKILYKSVHLGQTWCDHACLCCQFGVKQKKTWAVTLECVCVCVHLAPCHFCWTVLHSICIMISSQASCATQRSC